jgi:hypothetical protein
MEGEALLIAGHGADEVEDPRLPLITQLGEAVLASASPWRVRRLAAGGPERDAPSRGNVRRELDAVLSRPAIGRIVVIAAELTRTIEGLGVLCGRREGFEEDASVSLAWFANRLQRARRTCRPPSSSWHRARSSIRRRASRCCAPQPPSTWSRSPPAIRSSSCGR